MSNVKPGILDQLKGKVVDDLHEETKPSGKIFGLLRYFSIASAIALIAVTISLVYLSRDNEMEHLVVSAEDQNITLARSFANILWPRFSHYVMTVAETDGDRLRARPETAEIDEAVRALTAGLPVLKVKIYNLDGRTIYSSAPSQIGADKRNNPGFMKSARAGKPASKYSIREKFGAFSGTVMNRALVESYLPIWGADDAIEGVFELYTDVTSLSAEIDRRTDRLTAGLMITFALLYGILFVIVRRADQILKQQYTDLLENERTLQQRVRKRTVALEREVAEHELTEAKLRESENRFKDFAEAASDWFWEQDADLRFIAASPGVYEKSGVKAADHVGKTRRDIVSLGVTEEQWRQHEADLSARRPFRDFTFQRRNPSGELRDFSLSGKSVFDAEGRFKGYRGVATDITERKQTETALREAHDMLEQRVTERTVALEREIDERKRAEARKAEMETQIRQLQKLEAIGTLTGGIAHEFNNLLLPMLTLTELAMDDIPRKHPARDNLEKVLSAGSRAKILVQKISAYSRDKEPPQGPVELQPIVEETLGLLRTTLPATVEIRVDLDAGGAKVCADPSQIHQILMNLSSNAAEALDGKVGILEFRLHRCVAKTATGARQPHLKLVIQDNGSGMDKKTVERIFDPFYTTKEVGSGTGMGLAIVDSIVAGFGGMIKVKSEPGQGTAIEVLLPLWTEGDETDAGGAKPDKAGLRGNAETMTVQG